MRVLIAETDTLFLAAMKQALEQAGHVVDVANNGLGAWDYLVGPGQPDLLVTCLHLGAGQPPGTALGLQAQARDPRIPVVYILASADLAQLADAEHGAVLTKPFRPIELLAAIDMLLPTP